MSFPQLRLHSAYSLGLGAIKLEALSAFAKTHEIPAIAMTDRHSIAGAWVFQKAMKAAGVKPIIGATVGFSQVVMDTPVAGDVALLAMNAQGLQNLSRLLSKLAMEGANQEPRALTLADLEDGMDDIFLLSGGATSPLVYISGLPQAQCMAESLVQSWSMMLPGRVAIELHRVESAPTADEAVLLQTAQTCRVPVVAANETRFLTPDEHKAADVLVCVLNKRHMLEVDRPRAPTCAYLRLDMADLYADLPEVLKNTWALAAKASAYAPERAPMLPTFPVEEGQTEASLLQALAQEGLAARLQITPDYQARLDMELRTILTMGFAGYFLTVADFISWAKAQNIPVGPGRGSGAGSLVAWSLGITEVDPIRYGLLFERFLNPDRVSLPDFDVDFHQGRRDEVIQYVKARHGADRVAVIGTFGRILAKAAVRDAGRVLGLPFGLVDHVARLIPEDTANTVTIADALETNELQEMAKDAQVADLLRTAQGIEGLLRNQSTHAAGVVIAPKALLELAPMAIGTDGQPALLIDMKAVELTGLVKFDFLGLKTLDVLQDAEALAETAGTPITYDTDMNDKEVYTLLAKGHAFGVFQLESEGMRRTLRDVKPDCFEDLVAIISLYRPGPMAMLPTYASVKNGEQDMQPPHPALTDILRETHGVVVYQEQVMEIARKIAGYTLAQADLLRRAMGKKVRAEMEAQTELFLAGCVKNGLTALEAKKVFDVLERFAEYGFNKSHAAAYAVLAYKTALASTKVPAAFYASILQHDRNDSNRLAVVGQEARKRGIRVLRPSVNASQASFVLEDGAIRWSLSAVKGVGDNDAQALVSVRGARPYTSMSDLLGRLQGRVNRKALEALVKAGALDEIIPTRAEALAEIARTTNRKVASTQMGFFDLLAMETLPEMARQAFLSGERESLGFYLSGHPLEAMTQSQRGTNLKDLLDPSKTFRAPVEACAVIMDLERKRTRSGTKMAVLRLSDPSAASEVVAFEAVLGEGDLSVDRAYRFSLQARDRDGERRIVIENFEPITLS